jgi:hypothetical protein
MKPDEGENGRNENIKSEYDEDSEDKEQNRSKQVSVFRM